MSNITMNTQAINAIKKAWSSKLGAEDTFAKHMDTVKTHMSWTEAVSPTPNNIASGKSTASPEGYEELKKLFEGILKGKKRDHSSTAIGSEVKDLKNQLMLRQDPEIYADTKGNLSKIEAVEGDKVILKLTDTKTTIEMRDQLITNVKNWVEKNQAELGKDYTPTRKAILTVFDTLSIKR
tara:strand:+ start:209 stop:748 length:540 start_codon:yes stop_codon:yes gene_type:complete